MAGVRLTGLVSGFDTEAMVKQLSEAYQVKVDNIKKDQTKVEWKKEAWQTLNKKIMDFYKGALSNFSSVSTYRAKSIAETLTGVKVTAGNNAVNGAHKVKVVKTATAQMWTGKKINNSTYTSTSYKEVTDGTTKLSDLKDAKGYDIGDKINGAEFQIEKNGTPYNVKVNVGADATIDDVVTNINEQLDGSGLVVEFKNGAFHMTEPAGDINYEMKLGDVEKVYQKVETADAKVTRNTKLTDLGIAEGTEIKVNGNAITIDRETTLESLAGKMAKLGIEANYDEGQGRFYLNAKKAGEANGFKIEADDATLAALGLDLNVGDEGRIDAQDAEIIYNGVTYKQSGNTFEINGLSITASDVGEEQTFTVGMDTKGIYDKVKDFVKSYNELIEEMNNLYNAGRVKDFEPLTEDEKAAMSDEEVEKWEGLIKGSLLRRDDTIGTLLSSMRTSLSKAISVTGVDGTTRKYSLSSFGINTGVYTEKGKLHINGNADDADYADFEDALMKAINANPDAVEKTLSAIGKDMYNNLQKAMSSNKELSSALTFYNDKQLDKEIDEYKDKVSAMQDKMVKEEDKYYKQFSAMEAAMAKLQAQQSYVAQLFGGMGN